jgi:drug/metabolite transporter (DMT)-like permease
VTTGVVLAVLLAAALHAGWNALVKGRGADPLTSSFGLSVVWVVLGTPLALVAWRTVGLDPAVFPFLALSVCVHLVYFSLLVAAYGAGELSLVYPIARGTPPLLVALAATALGEPLGLVGAAGVGALTLGVLVLTPPGRGGQWRPAPVALALGSACCTACYTLLDGYGTRLAGSPVVYLSWLTAIQGALFALGALAWRGRGIIAAAWGHRAVAVGAGTMSAFGYGVALWAMAHAPLAAVAALRESSVPMAALLGAAWLGERLDRRRLVAVLLVAVGAVLLRLA